MVKELILQNRSYRRYDESKAVSRETLIELIDYARRTPSGGNKQPLRYFISNEKEMNDKICDCIGWAGYLEDWNGPEDGERPSAYIIMLSETQGNCAHDEGIAGQSILLMAAEQGLGGCFILNVNRDELKRSIGIPEKYFIKMIIALGTPVEKVVLEEISEKDDIKYYRDANQIHYVPKIKLDDVLVN